MSLNKIIVFMITVLVTFIQVEFQSKSLSPFETHYWIMLTFLVALSTYVLSRSSEIVEAQDESPNNHGVMSRISHLSGFLATVLLLLIILPVFGWATLILWTLYFIKTAYELLMDQLPLLFEELREAVDGQFDLEEEELPV